MFISQAGMLEISFDSVNDAPALATRWRALEAVSRGGFFRGWSFLGTLLPHFAAPHLLAVRQAGQDVALGLFNVTRSWRGTGLNLHEAGVPPWDSLFVEHNGLLLRPGAEACLPDALATALRQGAVILPGIDASHLHAAGRTGQLSNHVTRHAPAIDLAALTGGGRSYLDLLSANARAQIRRAVRLYGPELALSQARDLAEAQDFLDRLTTLHQASWTARGEPGAFVHSAIRAFHTQLIATALPRGEVALLRVAAGAREVGYLYHFQHGGCVLSYQTGLAAESDARLKPGLVCHALAIEHARAGGARLYDFLAGAQRYKASLVPQALAVGQDLHWVTLARAGSARARWAALRERAGYALRRRRRETPASL